MNQLNLFDSAGPLDQKFWEYHQENPHVYELFKNFTRAARAAGYNNYSAKAIFERVRWHMSIETKDETGFKLNNNYTSRYARLMEQEHPEYAGFFHKRTMKTSTTLGA